MDAKIAGLLSELAYRDTDDELSAGLLQYVDRLQGWTVFPGLPGLAARDGYPKSGTQGAFTIFINPTTSEIAFAFKGTNTFAEFADDVFSSGRRTIGNVMPRAMTALNDILEAPAYANYKDKISAVGHSLGGAEAQTFALEALATDTRTVVNSYYFDSLPISTSLVQQDILPALQRSGLQISSTFQAAQLYHDVGGRSQGVYYGGEIADLAFRTIGGGGYLNSQLSEVSSVTNVFVAFATILATKASAGLIGFLAGFIGVKGGAHRMELLNDAMQSLQLAPTGELLVPTSRQPRAVPEGWQASNFTTGTDGEATTVVLTDGRVVAVGSDGSISIAKQNVTGVITERETFNTIEPSLGNFRLSWKDEIYAESGALITTRSVTQTSDSRISYVENTTVDGLPASFAFAFNVDANVSLASVPSQEDLASNLRQARLAIYGQQSLDEKTKATQLADYFVAMVKTEKGLMRWM